MCLAHADETRRRDRACACCRRECPWSALETAREGKTPSERDRTARRLRRSLCQPGMACVPCKAFRAYKDPSTKVATVSIPALAHQVPDSFGSRGCEVATSIEGHCGGGERYAFEEEFSYVKTKSIPACSRSAPLPAGDSWRFSGDIDMEVD